MKVNYIYLIISGIIVSGIISCDSDDSNELNLENGLVAYYPFNGNANDESQNSNNGIVFGPVLTQDRFGNDSSAYSFDGVDDYIDLGTSKVFDLSNYDQFTISFWAISNEIEIQNRGVETIFSKHDTFSEDCSYSFERSQGSSALFFNIFRSCEGQQNEQGPQGNGRPFNFGVWSNYTWLYDNGDSDVYVDGEFGQSATLTIPIIASQASAIIGAKNFANDFYDENFLGSIDELRIYDRLLSLTEIELLSQQ